MYNLILLSSVASIMSLERTENVWLIEGAGCGAQPHA